MKEFTKLKLSRRKQRKSKCCRKWRRL